MSMGSLPRLPRVPCPACDHVDVPNVDVVHLSEKAEEHSYTCVACGHPIVRILLGAEDEVDRRAAELPGHRVDVSLHVRRG